MTLRTNPCAEHKAILFSVVFQAAPTHPNQPKPEQHNPRVVLQVHQAIPKKHEDMSDMAVCCTSTYAGFVELPAHR